MDANECRAFSIDEGAFAPMECGRHKQMQSRKLPHPA